MRRNWQTIPLVVVVGALAGAAIAGRPTTPANDVIIPPGAVATTTSTTLPPITAAPVTTGLVTTSSSTSPTSTSTTAAPRPTTTTTARATTTVVDEEAAAAAARASVRVLVANGTNRAGLAGSIVEQLRGLGYENAVAGDATRNYNLSVVHAVDGFRDAALLLAADLGIAEELVIGPPDAPITTDDSRGDVIFVAAADLP
jgi:hypothetical protein